MDGVWKWFPYKGVLKERIFGFVRGAPWYSKLLQV